MLRALQNVRAESRTAALFAALLVAAGYAVGGPIASRLALDPTALQGVVFALYSAAAALLAAEALPYAWRRAGPWPGAASVALRGTCGALAVFALLRVLPDLATASTPSPFANDILASTSRYLLPLRALSIAVLIAGVALALYRASFPLWRPVPPRSAVQAFAVSAAAWCLLGRDGIVAVRTGLDLGFYAVPVWTCAAGYASFWIVRLARVSRPAHTIAALVLWASIAVTGYLAFRYLNNLAVELVLSERYESIGDRVLPYLSVAAGIDIWFAAGAAVLGLERSTSGYTGRWQLRTLGPLFESGRSLALGIVFWGAAQHLQPLGSPAQVAGVVGFSALAAIAAGDFAKAILSWQMPGVARTLAAWLARSHFRNANVGGLIALYATVVRPSLYDATSYAPLIEWLGLAVPAAYLIARAAGGIGEQAALPPGLPAWREWRLHRQNASPVPDRALTRAASIREGYVETGESSVLAVRVATAMTAASRPIEEIVLVVSPLLDRAGSSGEKSRGARDARRLAAGRVDEALESAATHGARGAPLEPAAADALWSDARRAFVERGDRVRLAVATSMVGWKSGATRDVLTMQFGRIVQYRDAKPRWYDLPPVRRRVAESVPAARTGFADEIRSVVLAKGGPR